MLTKMVGCKMNSGGEGHRSNIMHWEFEKWLLDLSWFLINVNDVCMVSLDECLMAGNSLTEKM
jgi:hypothetical protein